MKLRLEKWYLDLSSADDVGFYYILTVSLGRLTIGFSGITHSDGSRSLRSFRFSRVRDRSLHALRLGNAQLSSTLRKADLRIDHGKTSISGTWRFCAPPQPRRFRPLYRNERGWCDWKVWAPKADVKLLIHENGRVRRVRGTGYIDFVRSTFPFWKSPLRSLYWGRMHSPSSWRIFLCLQTEDRRVAQYLDSQTAEADVDVRLNRDSGGRPLSMDWQLGKGRGDLRLQARVNRILESQEILKKGRLLKIVPPLIRKPLNSYGRDEKYAVTAWFRDEYHRGIMEEVFWNE